MSYKTKPLPPGTPAKEDRIKHIARLMANGEYFGMITCHKLADTWGLSIQSLRDDSAEAGRYLKRDPKERAQVQAEMAATVARIGEMALNKRNKVTGLPDYKSALEAIRLYGIWTGVSDRVELEAVDANKGPMKIEISYAKDEPSETVIVDPKSDDNDS